MERFLTRILNIIIVILIAFLSDERVEGTNGEGLLGIKLCLAEKASQRLRLPFEAILNDFQKSDFSSHNWERFYDSIIYSLDR